MKYLSYFFISILIIAGAATIVLSPDMLSTMIIVTMMVIMAFGVVTGIIPLMIYARGFNNAIYGKKKKGRQ